MNTSAYLMYIQPPAFGCSADFTATDLSPERISNRLCLAHQCLTFFANLPHITPTLWVLASFLRWLRYFALNFLESVLCLAAFAKLPIHTLNQFGERFDRTARFKRFDAESIPSA